MSITSLNAGAAYNKVSNMQVPKSGESKLPASYKASKSQFLKSLASANSAVKTGSITSSEKSRSFGLGDLVSQNLAKARKSTNQAENFSTKSLVNKASLVDVVTSLNEADVMVKTIVKVRDTVINAYNDILKMPI